MCSTSVGISRLHVGGGWGWWKWGREGVIEREREREKGRCMGVNVKCKKKKKNLRQTSFFSCQRSQSVSQSVSEGAKISLQPTTKLDCTSALHCRLGRDRGRSGFRPPVYVLSACGQATRTVLTCTTLLTSARGFFFFHYFFSGVVFVVGSGVGEGSQLSSLSE